MPRQRPHRPGHLRRQRHQPAAPVPVTGDRRRAAARHDTRATATAELQLRPEHDAADPVLRVRATPTSKECVKGRVTLATAELDHCHRRPRPRATASPAATCWASCSSNSVEVMPPRGWTPGAARGSAAPGVGYSGGDQLGYDDDPDEVAGGRPLQRRRPAATCPTRPTASRSPARSRRCSTASWCSRTARAAARASSTSAGPSRSSGAASSERGSPPSTGYVKDYRYDKRLKFSSPPYFPQWTNAEWSANYTGEINPSTDAGTADTAAAGGANGDPRLAARRLTGLNGDLP